MPQLLEVSDLEVRFDTPEGVVKAVNGMSFQLTEGETLAIVGESGSGKSQLVMAIMGLLAENGSASGRAAFRGRDLMQMTPRELNGIRGRHIAMIFQDPMTSLNPFLTIEKQMIEVVMHHQRLSRDEARAHAIEMLRAVRIPDPEERIRHLNMLLDVGSIVLERDGSVLLDERLGIFLGQPNAESSVFGERAEHVAIG